jgi:phenylacetate-CoA ligase
MSGAWGRRLWGAVVIASYVRGQRRATFLPRAELDALRDQRIRRMVRYAAKYVPFYRETFARDGIEPERIRGAADLDRLPVLDKDLVRARPEYFVAETAAARRGLSFLTSGSTGRPVSIRHDRRSLLANIAFGEREREIVNRACGGSFRPTELYVSYETSTFKKVEAFYAENALLPVRPLRRFVSLLEPVDRVVAIANEERPDLLVGYGGWLDLFFKTVHARSLPLHRPKLVLYMGEALSTDGRQLIEEGFGIPVMSRYNAVESFKIGFFCEQRTGFHVHRDLCHVRVVGPGGENRAPGEPGALVISNLINRATVLLNYPIGDVASLSAEPCACGRTFRTLSELEGRVEDTLHLSDGHFVHPRAVWQIFKKDPEVLQYRLIQKEPRHFAVELATVDDAAFARVVGRALPELERLLGPDATFETSRHERLLRRQGEKLRAVVSLRAATGNGDGSADSGGRERSVSTLR